MKALPALLLTLAPLTLGMALTSPARAETPPATAPASAPAAVAPASKPVPAVTAPAAVAPKPVASPAPAVAPVAAAAVAPVTVASALAASVTPTDAPVITPEQRRQAELLANAERVDQANRELLARNQELQLHNENLSIQNSVLKGSRNNEGMWTGAACIAAGFFMGWFFAGGFNRRKSNW